MPRSEIAARLLELVCQTIYGAHGPNRMQILNAIDALEKDNAITEDEAKTLRTRTMKE